jgi:hypothetical protein
LGHTRLGLIPKSRRWDRVVELVLESAESGDLVPNVGAIAAGTVDVASLALRDSASDPGLVYSFYLLAGLGLGGRRSVTDAAPFELDEHDSVYDLLAQLQEAVDDHVAERGGSSDFSEMAQQAAGTALLELLESDASSLFGTGRDELERGLKRIASGTGFSQLSQRFFGDYLSRFLNFYLSRVTAQSSRYGDFRQLNDFNDELRTYCYQSARIVSDFASAWLSRTAHFEGLTLENTERFMYVATGKLASELATATPQHGAA